jgi:anti-sigma factor RsiW
LQAYFDGELDAVGAAAVEQHVEHCAECRALLEDLAELRSALRRELSYERAPPELRARIMRTLDAESAGETAPDAPRPSPKFSAGRRRPFWAGALAGFGGAAIAASAAFLLLWPTANNALLDDLVSAHVRSLMPMHLIDVESTDRHTVKPWFAGHTDVSPVVADFTEQGFRLIGGRADYFAHQRAAAVVYQHGPHVINVFSWASDRGRPPDETARNGYHIACWNEGNLNYCAVSDTGWDELNGLKQLLKGLSAPR